MPMSFIMSKNVKYSWEKTPRELKERFTNFTHLYFLLISLINFRYFSFLGTALLLRLDLKATVNSGTYRHLDWIIIMIIIIIIIIISLSSLSSPPPPPPPPPLPSSSSSQTSSSLSPSSLSSLATLKTDCY